MKRNSDILLEEEYEYVTKSDEKIQNDTMTNKDEEAVDELSIQQANSENTLK